MSDRRGADEPPEASEPDVRWLQGRALGEWLLVTLCACAFVWLLSWSGVTRGADLLIYDGLARLAATPPSDRVVIVAIDDDSLKAVGAWPWSRETHARLLDRLTAGRAAAVGYDVMFLEPGQGDAALARALSASGRTVLPVSVAAPGDDGRAVKVLRPLVALARAAAALGHVQVSPDPDGVVRRGATAVAVDGECWPHLTQRLLVVAGAPVRDDGCARLAAAALPAVGLVSPPMQLIPFAGSSGSFRTVSAADVLAGDTPPEFLRDRFVLVGATALGLGDRHETSTSGVRGPMAGVELQADLLDAALRHRQRAEIPPPWLWFGEMAPTLALSLLLFLLKPSTNLPVALGLAGLTTTVCAALFVFAATWTPILPALAGLAAIHLLWTWRRLVLASHALAEEIDRLPPHPAAPMGVSDPLSRQLASLSGAAARLRGLNRTIVANARQREEVLQLLTHDLRAPLASIIALTDAPEGDRDAASSRRIGDYARRGLDLAEGYVQLARAETMVLRTEPLDLSELVLEAIDELWPQAAAKGVSFETVAPPAPILIDADRSLLTRALINLLGNALKFSPEGGAILACTTLEADLAVCTVEDEGPGLPHNSDDRLFDAFQLGRDPERGRTGVGLGLAIVKMVAQRHGGSVSGENRAGGGGRFTLRLPLSSVEEEPIEDV